MPLLRILLFLLLSTVLLAGSAHAQLSLNAFALTDATLIDAKHPNPLPHQTVLINGNRIDAIFPDGSRPLGDSITVFPLKGKFLIPGLIDTHVHLATDPSDVDNRASTLTVLNTMLYSGITSVRDMAGDARTLAGLSRDALTGDILSPDIYFSALMAGPSFFDDPRTIATAKGGIAGQMPYMRAVTDSTDLVLAVAEAKGTGATGIKLYAQLSGPLVVRIVAEAKRQGLLVWGHAWLSPAKPSDLIRAGVSSISHAPLLFRELLDSIPASWKKPGHPDKFWDDNIPASTSLFQSMKEHNTILDATLTTYNKWGRENPAYQYNYEIAKIMTARAYKAGVRICAGTDDDQDSLVQREMHLLVKDAGFSPFDALMAATRNGAEALGIDGKCGTIEVGKAADLVVLDRNPLDNIDNVKTVSLVIKGGRVFKK